MRRPAIFCGIIILIVHTWTGVALADETKDCLTLVDKSIAFITEKGRDYALKTICCKGPFTQGDVYVFAVSMDNVVLAHPYNRELIGKKVDDLKDVKGLSVFAEFKKVAANGGSGWVDYWWAKPGEKGEFPKKVFIKKVPGEDIYVGAGFYVK